MNTPTAFRTSTTSPLAVVSLVFGLAAWVALPVAGAIVAIVCGHMARAEIRRAPAAMIEGDGLAVAGLVLAYLQLACVLAGLVILALVMAGLFVAAQP